MIYCVEDEAAIRNMMVYTLSASGYEAEGVDTGKKLYEKLKERKPKLIMLDLNLPGEDGLSVLKTLKSNPETDDIPVIIATARGTEYDKVLGLDSGADDYLAKPFGMMEMLSRVKAVLRRCETRSQKKVFSLGPITLNTTSHSVTVGGESVKLTGKEYELLALLVENVEKVFSREELMKSIWGINNLGETRTVDVHVATLRNKIGDGSRYIETVRGVGYRAHEERH